MVSFEGKRLWEKHEFAKQICDYDKLVKLNTIEVYKHFPSFLTLFNPCCVFLVLYSNIEYYI